MMRFRRKSLNEKDHRLIKELHEKSQNGKLKEFKKKELETLHWTALLTEDAETRAKALMLIDAHADSEQKLKTNEFFIKHIFKLSEKISKSKHEETIKEGINRIGAFLDVIHKEDKKTIHKLINLIENNLIHEGIKEKIIGRIKFSENPEFFVEILESEKINSIDKANALRNLEYSTEKISYGDKKTTTGTNLCEHFFKNKKSTYEMKKAALNPLIKSPKKNLKKATEFLKDSILIYDDAIEQSNNPETKAKLSLLRADLFESIQKVITREIMEGNDISYGVRALEELHKTGLERTRILADGILKETKRNLGGEEAKKIDKSMKDAEKYRQDMINEEIKKSIKYIEKEIKRIKLQSGIKKNKIEIIYPANAEVINGLKKYFSSELKINQPLGKITGIERERLIDEHFEKGRYMVSVDELDKHITTKERWKLVFDLRKPEEIIFDEIESQLITKLEHYTKKMTKKFSKRTTGKEMNGSEKEILNNINEKLKQNFNEYTEKIKTNEKTKFDDLIAGLRDKTEIEEMNQAFNKFNNERKTNIKEIKKEFNEIIKKEFNENKLEKIFSKVIREKATEALNEFKKTKTIKKMINELENETKTNKEEINKIISKTLNKMLKDKKITNADFKTLKDNDFKRIKSLIYSERIIEKTIISQHSNIMTALKERIEKGVKKDLIKEYSSHIKRITERFNQEFNKIETNDINYYQKEYHLELNKIKKERQKLEEERIKQQREKEIADAKHLKELELRNKELDLHNKALEAQRKQLEIEKLQKELTEEKEKVVSEKVVQMDKYKQLGRLLENLTHKQKLLRKELGEVRESMHGHKYFHEEHQDFFAKYNLGRDTLEKIKVDWFKLNESIKSLENSRKRLMEKNTLWSRVKQIGFTGFIVNPINSTKILFDIQRRSDLKQIISSIQRQKKAMNFAQNQFKRLHELTIKNGFYPSAITEIQSAYDTIKAKLGEYVQNGHITYIDARGRKRKGNYFTFTSNFNTNKLLPSNKIAELVNKDKTRPEGVDSHGKPKKSLYEKIKSYHDKIEKEKALREKLKKLKEQITEIEQQKLSAGLSELTGTYD